MKQPSEHPYLDAVEQAYHTLANDAEAIIERGEKRWTTKLSSDTIQALSDKLLHVSTYQGCREYLRAQRQFAFAKTHQGIYNLLWEIRTYRIQEGSFEIALEKIQQKYHIPSHPGTIMHVIRVLGGKGLHVLKALIDEMDPSSTKRLDEITQASKGETIDVLTAPNAPLELFPTEHGTQKTKKKGRKEPLHPY